MDPSQKKQDDELLQLVTFSIGEEEFGVNILKVQEIIRTMEITKVPRAPEFVEGVINLRGKVIPIIDLRRRFGLVPKAHDKNTRIIVIEINNIIVGLWWTPFRRFCAYPPARWNRRRPSWPEWIPIISAASANCRTVC